jgi:hypothetical protein
VNLTNSCTHAAGRAIIVIDAVDIWCGCCSEGESDSMRLAKTEVFGTDERCWKRRGCEGKPLNVVITLFWPD